MTGDAQAPTPQDIPAVALEQVRDPRARAAQPLVHHGRTKAAWVGSVGATFGFIIAALGFVLPLAPGGEILWSLVWFGFAVVLVSTIAGGVLSRMGMGQSDWRDMLDEKVNRVPGVQQHGVLDH